MAVVKTLRTRNGALVRIHDDAYRDCTPEEIARRKAETARIMGEIEWRAACRRYEELKSRGEIV